jgi:hypothetical protein
MSVWTSGKRVRRAKPSSVHERRSVERLNNEIGFTLEIPDP